MKVRPFRFFGLFVERKTDVLALAAFLISASTLGANLYFLWQGPKPQALAPSYIGIYEFKCARNGVPWTDVLARVPLWNEAPKGYPTIITRAFITLELNTQDGQHKFAFEVASKAASQPNNVAVEDEIDCMDLIDGVLVRVKGADVVRTGEFQPLILDGGEASGQTYLYSGTYFSCHLEKSCDDISPTTPFEAILSAAEAAAEYRFVFSFFDQGQNEITASCSGKFSISELDALKQNRRADLSCIESASPI